MKMLVMSRGIQCGVDFAVPLEPCDVACGREHQGQRRSFAKAQLKTIEAFLEEKLIEYIEANGPIECGDMLYVVGTDKTSIRRPDNPAP